MEIQLLLLLLVTLTIRHTDASKSSRNGCAKTALSSRSKLNRPNLGHVHIVNDLLSGLKRSTNEEEDDNGDCIEKKSKTPLKQEANSAVTKSKTTKQLQNQTIESKSFSAKRSQTLALSHIVKIQNQNAVKRGLLKSPNLKTLKHSPLWSLSKLIDDVSSITAKKRKNITEEKPTFKVSHVFHPTLNAFEKIHKLSMTKGTIEPSEENKGLKATLANAIQNVEKVVANKNGELTKSKDVPAEAEKLIAFVKKINKTIEGVRKSSGNITSPPLPLNNTAKTVKTVKAPLDPYAEIAAGPDRPKLPELKAGDDTVGASDGPVMKLAGDGMQQMSGGDVASKSSSPLSGEHDVGGLLDSLTDKLNSAGGGVAPDQPLNGNDVKYLTSQLGMEESEMAMKQSQQAQQSQQAPLPAIGGEQEPVSPEAEQQAALPHGMNSPNLDVPKEESMNNAPKLPIDESAAAKMIPGQNDDVDKEVMDKLAATEEGLSKSINDKTNSLNRLGTMDMLKGGKGEMSDYGDADVSPGPDPYAMPGADPGRTGGPGLGAAFGHEEESSEMLNGPSMGGIPQESMERGVSESMVQPDPGTYEQPVENNPAAGYEQSGELTADTRSRTKSDEYLSSMGSLTDDIGYNTRHNIPDSGWNEPKDTDSFSNSYNTQLFKRNVILRPKKDNYVSPFSGKESFENDV